MEDRSKSLENWTCAHIMEKVSGDVGSTFRNGLFVRDAEGIKTWGGYHMFFEDEGVCVRLGLADGERAVNVLRDRLLQMGIQGEKIPRKYQKVIRKVCVLKEKGRLYVDMYMGFDEDGVGKVRNRRKFCHAIYNVGVKPVLRAIFDLSQE